MLRKHESQRAQTRTVSRGRYDVQGQGHIHNFNDFLATKWTWRKFNVMYVTKLQSGSVS